VVEDEPRMRDLLRAGLREHGHTVMASPDGEDALALAQAHAFDVVLLDLMLPGISGQDVMLELRRKQNPTSVLMLTARSGELDIIEGLDSGADDYLTKPFSFHELLARLQCLDRARNTPPRQQLSLDDLTFDATGQRAYRSGRDLELTRTELQLLSCLLKHQGRVVSRAALLTMVWGANQPPGRSALDSFVSLLRKKVDLPGMPKLLHTVKGEGYTMFKEAPASRRLP